MTQDQLLAALYEAVHPNGENGLGKTTAFGLRDFLRTLIDELLARTSGSGAGGGASGPGGSASGGVLTSPLLRTFRLTVGEAGELGTAPADGQPIPDPLGVLTSEGGRRYRLSVADDGALRAVPAAGAVDPDAAAFCAAAGLVNVAQQEAVNQLVLALKASRVWPRLRALYPMVGGTARAHALNLKDPRDADEAFRLTFFNNPRHDELGTHWDGVSQYADTHLDPRAQLTRSSGHLGYYATSASPSNPSHVEIGVVGDGQSFSLVCSFDGGAFQAELPGGGLRAQVASVLGFSLASRQGAAAAASYRDGQLVASSGQYDGDAPFPGGPLLLAHRNDGFYSDRTCALACIGDGLAPAEALALSAAVADFQRALGRDVALDDDARAFVLAAGLTDITQVAALNELVKSLKASGVWERLRAVYPMVGGTERAHALNLRDPRDADSAFRLLFVNGPQHTARGVEWRPEASTFATTSLVPAEHLSPTDHHLAYYAATDGPAQATQVEIGASSTSGSKLSICVRHPEAAQGSFFESCGATAISERLAHGLGFTLDVRQDATTVALYRDGQALAQPTPFAPGGAPAPGEPLYLGGRQEGFFSSKACGFASVGGGLTPAQARAYSAAVRAFQQALGRDVTLAPALLRA
jgi:hypothetical protein